MEDQTFEVGTLSEIENFHNLVMNSVFTKNKVDFDMLDPTDKKYYIVPIKAVLAKEQQMSMMGKDEQSTPMTYELDHKMLKKSEQFYSKDSQTRQPNVTEKMSVKDITDSDKMIDYLKKHILLNLNRPQNCYKIAKLMTNLKKPAQELLEAITGENCDPTS